MTLDDDAVVRMLDGYKPIIEQFLSGELSADEFESRYLSYFKNDKNQVVGDQFDVLDGLFADVDEYVGDPRLRAAGRGIDGDELRSRARRAYDRLYGGP